MDLIKFRNFFAQMNDLEIDFVITHLNRNAVFDYQIYRSNVGDLDAKFIKLFIKGLDFGELGRIVQNSIDQKIQL